MKLFSENVYPTYTNTHINILSVENFEEIFFGVYEIEINKNKYPVEKISEHNGNPVVSIPVEVKGKKANYPFVLTRGKFDILFNENSDYVELFESKIEEVEKEPELIVEKIVEEKIQLAELEDKKHLILEEIKNAKQKALEATEKEIRRKKQLQLRQIKEESEKKEEALRSYLESARENLVDEFVEISNKIKLELIGSNDNRFSEISETIDNKIQDLANTLSESLKKDFNTSSKQFDSSIRQLIKELYEKQINAKVDKELKNIAKEIVEKVDTIKGDLFTKLDTKVEKTLVEGLEREVDAIRDANIELNNTFNKGVNRALSRVGNVDKKVDELTIAVSEDIESKISSAEENIKDYYNQRLQMLEEKAFDINEETRKYFISLIQESKDNLISEIRKIKNEKPIEYIIEANGKKEVKDFDSIQKDFDKKISSKIDTEVTRLRKYIAVYSGGGSVAQQFAAGGIMNGDLTIVGSISAQHYLGLNIPSGNYLPLSGGTITGNVNVVGELSAQRLSFDTTAGLTAGVGQLTWNATDSTLNLGINNDVTLQLGQEVLVQVKADEALSNGQVVFASGAAGSGSANITVSAYRANAAGPDEMYMLGVATQDFAKNEFGFVTTFGKVRDVVINNVKETTDSTTWVVGTVLYISATERGRFTSTPPVAPNKSMPIVMVISVNGNKVTFLVRSEHGYHLNEIHDVATNNVQNNDILAYNSLSGVWTNSRNLVVNSLSANIINALSANITVIDIKQYELSGFNVQGNTTVQGTISATGPIYSGGNQVATVVDPVRTTLTGNGVLSTFAISGANTLVNPSALIVAIDGAMQEPGVDYTVLSGSITFTSPLPNGSKAVVISPTNSLQVSQMIPADGSVTSAKLDNSLTVQNLTVENLTASNTTTLSGQTSAANQTYNSLDSILTPRVNAGLRGYVLNRKCNVGGTWANYNASGGSVTSRPDHLILTTTTTLNSKAYAYAEQVNLTQFGIIGTNGYSTINWSMSEMWVDWVFSLSYAANRTNQTVRLIFGAANADGLIVTHGGIGVRIDNGSSPTNYDIRVFHLFTANASSRGNITAATNASPIVITQNYHGFETGTQVEIDGCVGNTAANGIWTVTKIDTHNYSLNSSTGNGVWSSGGSSNVITDVLLNTNAFNSAKLARIHMHKINGVFNVYLNDTTLLASIPVSNGGGMGFGILGMMAKTLVAGTGTTNMYVYEANYGGKL